MCHYNAITKYTWNHPGEPSLWSGVGGSQESKLLRSWWDSNLPRATSGRCQGCQRSVSHVQRTLRVSQTSALWNMLDLLRLNECCNDCNDLELQWMVSKAVGKPWHSQITYWDVSPSKPHLPRPILCALNLAGALHCQMIPKKIWYYLNIEWGWCDVGVWQQDLHLYFELVSYHQSSTKSSSNLYK